MRSKRFFLCLVMILLAVACNPFPSCADSELIDASQASVRGSVAVSLGTIDLLSAVGELTVVSVEAGVDAVGWVLEGVVEATGEVVRFTISAAEGVSLGVGAVIEVVGVSTGWLLTSAGSVVGFVADAIGESIYHSSVHR